MLSLPKRFVRLVILLGPLVPAAQAPADEPRTITIAYTSDIHDHLLPGPGGIGGFAIVATFIDKLRAEHEDLIVVDSGDATEKGDLAAYLRRGALIYDLMREVGYDMAAVGNHEENFGLSRVVDFNAHAGGILAALNLRDRDGNLIFPPFRIVGKEGRRVGIIGAALTSVPGPGPRGVSTANGIEETALLIRDYAELLRARHDVDVVVVVTHAGLEDIRKLAALEPDVDVFFAGHSHTVIEEPVVVNERGSIVVQAGDYANFVGVLQLTFRDSAWTATNRIEPMLHAKYPPHAAVMEAIAAVHAELDFDPREVIGTADEAIGPHRIARLAATALREHYGVDVAFVHPTWIVRNILYPGPITANDVFKTMADRAESLVRLELTGAQIEHYLNALANKPRGPSGGSGWGQTLAAGFRAATASTESSGGPLVVATDLRADTRYSVIMTRREWDWRFSRLLRDEGRALPAFTAVDGGTFRPLLAYVRSLGETRSLSGEADGLAERFGRPDPDEREIEARVIGRQLTPRVER